VPARVVVGADGAASRVADAVCPRRDLAPLLAIRAEIAQAAPLAETALVDVGRYPGGYAWAFPVGDRANVGVMVSRAHGGGLEHALGRFLAGSAHFSGGLPAGVGAAPVAAFRERAGECAAPGILLAGDAAQLADPFLGEGIYYALWSGTLAADAILAGGDGEAIARRYRAAVEGAIWPELRAAERIGLLFHCMPRWWFRVLSRLPGGILQYAGVLAGEESYRGLVRRVIDRVERQASRWALARLGVGQDGGRAQTERPGEGQHGR
jgi:flavin-dependent dehydrogenase